MPPAKVCNSDVLHPLFSSVSHWQADTPAERATILARLGLRQLPVVPEGALRPVGLLRRSDVLEAYAQAVSGARPPSPELQ